MTIADAERKRCKSCGAPIVWTITEKGKRMPVDPERVPGGNLEEWESPDSTPRVRVAQPPVLPFAGLPQIADAVTVQGPPGYVSHFATCPQADQHRRS